MNQNPVFSSVLSQAMADSWQLEKNIKGASIVKSDLWISWRITISYH